MAKIVLIAGFESFNIELYRQAATLANQKCAELAIKVFSDRDITTQPESVAEALEGADVFFASLVFDYDQVLWLQERVQDIPIRLVFESALELMSLTRLGKFVIGAKPKGMPKPVQFILSKFSSGREEDKLAGYISFLKTGPKLLKYVPVKKVQDLRNWLIIYGYWNAGGLENVAAMFWTLAQNYLNLSVSDIPAVTNIPAMGLLHPDYDGYFEAPDQYLSWYRQRYPEAQDWPTVGILLYRKHVVTKQAYIPQLIQKFEQCQLLPLPIFINGVEGHIAVRDWMTSATEQMAIVQWHAQKNHKTQNVSNPKQAIAPGATLAKEAISVDAIVSTIGFPLVGGPAGSMEQGRQVETAKRILSSKNVPYVVAAPLLIQDLKSWTRQGIGGLQSVVLYALPELDGAIDTIPLGGLVGNDIYLIPERVDRLTQRIQHWIQLRRIPIQNRKLAIILYGFPPGFGAVGTAALLNVPKSLLNLLKALQDQGYDVGDLPQDGEEILNLVRDADSEIASHHSESESNRAVTHTAISAKTLRNWLGYVQTQRVEKQWRSLTASGIKTRGEDLIWGGVQFGNVWIGVQPPLGISGDPMRLMFERDMTPHPQYAAFYQWLQKDYQAQALIHFGMHGTVEWLPGSPLGNTGYSWPDILLGSIPNLYIYAANNPSESILAKRRGYGVLISHNVPPYGRVELYKELATLKELIAEYRENPANADILRDAIAQKIIDGGIEADCPFLEAQKLGIAFNLENARLFSKDAFRNYLVEVNQYLQLLETRLFSSGLHVLGQRPKADAITQYLAAYFGDDLDEAVINAVAHHDHRDTMIKRLQLQQTEPFNLEKLDEAITIRDLLLQTPDEMKNLIRGLNGEYIPAAPGGDLLRDGPGVLPTGRNIHALDPYRMPSAAAFERGRAIAKNILAQHLSEHQTYPETVAVMLWGLDAIKTKGESIGILLELVGAEPFKEGTGRIVRYGLKPLSDLDHPRIDVLANLSGIFRDSFVNILELLDDLFVRAAEADESPEKNYIRKHAIALKDQGIENPSARLFSNPAGDFGSLVNDRVTDSNWESADELGQTWRGRNEFSYGRQDKGQARPEVLETLLKTTGRIVQQIDSVEYGLTDIQEYYANTGALKQAAEQQKGAKITASFVESFSKDNQPRKLEELLRIEYRTKLLNPQWAEKMADQGSGGAYEISQRMTAMVGWAGTTQFQEDWVYDQSAETYALDLEMAAKLRAANPEAFRNIVARMLEAHGRGFWTPEEGVLQKLRSLYDETELELEGVSLE